MPHKVVMLTLEHSPLDDRIFYKEAASLRDAGYDVHVVCRGNGDGVAYEMDGRTAVNAPGQDQVDVEGIHVHVVRFPSGSLHRMMHKAFRGAFCRRFVALARGLRASIYHAHEPSSYYLGLRIVRGTPAKLIFDSHESWLGGSRKDRWVRRVALPKLQYLIAANPMTLGQLKTANPNIEGRVVYNYAQRKVFDRPPPPDRFARPILAHDGILPFNRGLREMIEALHLVKQAYPDIQLRLIGETKGQERAYLRSAMERYDLANNVTETGWVPYHEVAKQLHGCAIGLLLKTPEPVNNVMGGPAIKLFNYFASGMAVIDTGLPESTRILDQVGAGISVWERSPQAIADAILDLLGNREQLETYGDHAYAAFERFCWEREQEVLCRFYSFILESPAYQKR